MRAWCWVVLLGACAEPGSRSAGPTSTDVGTAADSEVSSEALACEAPGLPRSVQLQGIPNDLQQSRDFTITGVVKAITPDTITLATEGEDVSLHYDFGGLVLPVAREQRVSLRWVWADRPFPSAGFVLSDEDGAILAMADLGGFQRGFGPVDANPLPEGWSFTPTSVGCAAVPGDCGTSERLGLVATHDDDTVTVQPGGEGLITLDGQRLRIIDTGSGELRDLTGQCSDLSAGAAASWLVLAEPGFCVDPPSRRIEASIRGASAAQLGQGAFTVAGTLASLDDDGFVLTTDDGDLTVDYDLAGHALPVDVGDAIVLRWVEVGSAAFKAIGFALSTPDGELLAMVDTGSFGSAWRGMFGVADMPDGFDVQVEPRGCRSVRDACASTERVGLRFTRGPVAVSLAPGTDGELVGDDGERFQIVDLHSERLTTFSCLDQAPRVSWIVTRAD